MCSISQMLPIVFNYKRTDGNMNSVLYSLCKSQEECPRHVPYWLPPRIGPALKKGYLPLKLHFEIFNIYVQ